MNMSPNVESRSLSVSAVSVFMTQVYQWMTVGLLLTAGVAWYASGSEALMNALFGNRLATILLFVLMIGLPLGLQGMLPRLSAGAATLWFMVYSAVVGLALSSLMLVYTGASLTSTFLITAGTFGGMSVYGMVTKRDLTSMGSLLIMGVWGLILASVVNMFLQSPALYYLTGAVGVLIFTGLTAFDTQKLRVLGENAPLDNTTVMRRGVIMGALTLYLDFINLFLMLLRFFGDRR